MPMKHEASAVSLALSVSDGRKSEGRPSDSGDQKRGLRITWRNLTYTVKNQKNKKEDIQLIKGISGFLEPGFKTALMGPSGCGKTTLLDILAGRKTTGRIEGELLYGGVQPSQTFLRRYTGYVEQFDTLLGSLTVEEMLRYTADLKLPVTITKEEKARRVDALIAKLGLQVCRNRKIGTAMQRGISGGQAKRVNIGIALITDPRILFLDEPTTGLDSYTATEVMKVVREVANSGVTVCATIHSPTEACFKLFDMLVLMLQGKIVYMGRIGRPAINFFTESKLAFRNFSEEEDTEAEWLVNVSTYLNRQGDAPKLIEFYEGSSLKKWDDQEMDLLVKTAGGDLNDEMRSALTVKRECETSLFNQIKTLMRYRSSQSFRDGQWIGPRFFDRLMISLILVSLYTAVGVKTDERGLFATTAVLFMWTVSAAFGAAAVVPAIVLEKKLYSRERNDGLFYPLAYLTYKITEEVGMATISSLINSLITFYGLKLKGQFGFFWIHYVVGVSVGVLFAYLVATLAPSMDAANAILPAFMVTQMFFNGFLIIRSTIPNWWFWYHILSFTSYMWMGLMQNNFEGNDKAILAGKQVLHYYSIPNLNPWAYTGLTAIFSFVVFILTWIALKYKKAEDR